MMKYRVWICFAFFLFITEPCHLIKAETPLSELTVLRLMYANMNGGNWVLQNGWNDPQHGVYAPSTQATPCTWYGITCDPTQQHITRIELRSNYLQGLFPSFVPLPYLTHLDFSNDRSDDDTRDNDLYDNDITHITDILPHTLISLKLYSCNIKGILPNFNTHLHLQTLVISDTPWVTGTVPSFQDHTDFIRLDLFKLALSGGEIPFLKNKPKLTYFDLTSCNISDVLPDFSFTPLLTYLSLSHNQITGDIPPSISSLYHLQYLALDYNTLIGHFPDITNLTSLYTITFNDNQLSGKLPNTLIYHTQLQIFDVGNNQFIGSLPAVPPSITKFGAGNNQLTGAIPSFEHVPRMYNLSLHHNQLTGRFPTLSTSNQSIWGWFDISCNQLVDDLSNVQFPISPSYAGTTVNISHNQFYGSLSQTITTAGIYYGVFDISFNQFNGTLPSFKNLIYLWILLCNNNAFIGDIVELQDNLPADPWNGFPATNYLTIASFAHNQFNGRILTNFEKFQNSQLQSIDFSNNYLIDIVPIMDRTVFAKLTQIDISCNTLSPPLPSQDNDLFNQTCYDQRNTCPLCQSQSQTTINTFITTAPVR